MFRKTLKIITDHIATLNGQTFAYKLIQSPIARTIRLKINMNSGLEIIVPRRLSPLGHFRPDHLDDIFQKHENWILKQLIKLEARKKLRDQHQLQNGSTLTILGEPHKIKILPGYSKKPKIKRVQSLIFTNESAIIDAHTFNIYCDGTIPHAKKNNRKIFAQSCRKIFRTTHKRTRATDATHLQSHHGPWTKNPLGKLFTSKKSQFQLATHHAAGRRGGIRHHSRIGAHGAHESLAKFLCTCGKTLPGISQVAKIFTASAFPTLSRNFYAANSSADLPV